LSTKDYLYRNFRLLKLESCYEIRQDILDSVEKITPVYSNKGDFSHFDSWARMGIPLPLEKNMNDTPNNNIPKKIRLHIIIECDANPEDDNEWTVAEVTRQTQILSDYMSFDNECWLDEVEEIL
jgi:hypothetical protein